MSAHGCIAMYVRAYVRRCCKTSDVRVMIALARIDNNSIYEHYIISNGPKKHAILQYPNNPLSWRIPSDLRQRNEVARLPCFDSVLPGYSFVCRRFKRASENLFVSVNLKRKKMIPPACHHISTRSNSRIARLTACTCEVHACPLVRTPRHV